MLIVPNTHHNNLMSHPKTLSALCEFLRAGNCLLAEAAASTTEVQP